jgi:hypothetical protein
MVRHLCTYAIVYVRVYIYRIPYLCSIENVECVLNIP